MARTVEKILEDDKNKASLGIDEDDVIIEGEEGLKTGEKAPTTEQTVEDLRKQLGAETARADREAEARQEEADGRREAEARAVNASTTAGNALQSQIETAENAIENKIVAGKTNLEAIKTQLKQAKAAGDTDAEVELQDALTNARYDLNTAEWEKKNFATWKENQKRAQTAAAAEKPTSPYTAKEQAWISDHPEFSKNKKFARLAKTAAGEALDEGHKQDTPAYFKYIEDVLKENGFLGAKKDQDEEDPLSGAGNTNTSIAAAPNRTGNSTPTGPNKNSKYPYVPKGFTIPADWVQAAEDQGFEGKEGLMEYTNLRLEEESKQGPAR